MLPVVIAGGGPVGLALALCLRQAGIDCLVCDARPEGAQGADRRVLALSHGSRQILERLGAWTAIGATPITSIHVSQQGRFGRTLIHAEEAGVPALGYVTEAARIAAALRQTCNESGVPIRHEARITDSEIGAGCATVRCVSAAGSETITAQLLAWAEGAVSDGHGVIRRDYGQRAIVAAIETREPSRGVAYERFAPDGAVALLPQGSRHALVWTVPEAAAAGLSALDDSAFLARLSAVFSGRLDFVAVGARATFPLGLRYRESPVGKRAVWLGNAAQTLHPVAGQGFNLALRDVIQLGRLLQEYPDDCGSAAVLARHASARRADRRAVISFTDALVRLFGPQDPLSAHARGAGLFILDLLPAARRFLARRMIFGARAW